ncbi:MAG: plasmid stabilization system [Thermoanaerobaculia bacterium]|nr:plasmid stabilization system [Thermoanaerobaculia bacterium]
MKPSVHKIRDRLPGNIRHRIRQLLDQLRDDPRPSNSRALELPAEAPAAVRKGWEVHRARIEDWRIIYAIHPEWNEVGVLLIARRPPYSYEDLDELLAGL